jgi:FMN phosphatase YigB (HAD superfamily)
MDEVIETWKRFHPDPSKIMYSNPTEEPEFIKPYFGLRLFGVYHIGTDYLHEIGKNWYDYLVEKGVQFHWEAKVTSIDFSKNNLSVKELNQETIKKQGFHAYIFSNKPHALTVQLIEHVFPKRFQGVHGHKPGTLPKPDTTMFDIFAKTHRIDPKQSVFIGDSPPDIEMGQRLGMPTIAVTYGYTDVSTLKRYQPTHIVHDASAIEAAVKSIIQK